MPGFKNRTLNMSPASKAVRNNYKVAGTKSVTHITEILPVMEGKNVVALFIYNGFAIKEFVKSEVGKIGGSVTFQTKSDGVDKLAAYVSGYWDPSDGSDIYTIEKEINGAIYNDIHTTVNAGNICFDYIRCYY
jgi:hypothetical protein